MSDLIDRQTIINLLTSRAETLRGLYGDLGGAASGVRKLIQTLPSAEPEQKNQKTALSVQVKVDFDDMKALFDDIGNLQTYKFFEGNDMVLANIEDIKGVLTKHVKAKEVQPERKKGKLKTIGFLTCQCSECKAQFHELEYTNFCPNCGTKWNEE